MIKFKITKLIAIIALTIICQSCDTKTPIENTYKKTKSAKKELTSFVNPFVGTKNMGHTYPGATTPFGMVQLSPETNIEPIFKDGKYNPKTYAYCSGYQHQDSTIFGFSHTHFSGTGHADLGDFLVMPTIGKLKLNPGEAGENNGYHSRFKKNSEEASPGFYKVHLEDYAIDVALTTSDRVGFHEYTFPKSDSAHVLLDLRTNIYDFEGKNIWTFVRVENDSTITGYRQTKGWARTRKVFFAMQFSKKFESYGHIKEDQMKYNGFYRRFNEKENFPEIAGKNICAYFNFGTAEKEKILVKFALSPVSTEGAIKNMNSEIPDWDFNRIKNQSAAKWNVELHKIVVESTSKKDKETFYTALYHTMLGPVLYEDVDGKYRGLDQNIHQSTNFTNYTVFSLWDTYRALHPLFNITQPKRNNDMIHSMLAHYDQSVHKALPIWSHYANENWCMIGYHSVSVIADALAKGTTNIDIHKALNACDHSANLLYYDGLDKYVKKGYVPEDKSNNSVSKTLEFAYDDWCIAQIANFANNDVLKKNYTKRADNYTNVFDPKSNYMRPKYSTGKWKEPFDPLDTHGQGFIEGNAWNYGLYVPQAIPKMIKMMGGKEAFSKHLDRIFTTPIEEKYIENNEDITRDGIIGNYVHGNEPGHHIPYLYNWTTTPWKSQERVRMIMETMYSNQEDGLCGNDDAGQMSAWYVFSALGFYPVCPGSEEYAIGSPLVQNAIIHLANGNSFEIKTVNQSKENVYIQKIELNEQLYKHLSISHKTIEKGGTLTFFMGNNPNKEL